MTVGDVERIRVMIVDDHASYGFGLKALIEALTEDIRVVDVVTSVDDVVSAIEEHLPDLVLLDVRMPQEREGVEEAKKICHLFPSAKVVMLTASHDPQDVVETTRCGVRGYLSKEIDAEQLLWSLRAVHSGAVVLSPFAAALLLEADDQETPLSDEEIHLLKLLARGHDIAEVAKEMLVSESTLKRQLREVQRKLRVKTRIEAIVLATKRGLI